MLKFVPLIGWAWMFTESIFLKRTWDKDKEIISRDLKYIRDYPDGYWVTVSRSFNASFIFVITWKSILNFTKDMHYYDITLDTED